MAKTYSALVCCPAGLSTSMVLKVKSDQVIKEKKLPVVTRHGEMSVLKTFKGDFVITMVDLVDTPEVNPNRVPVVKIANIFDKAEIAQKLEAWVAAQA